MLLGRAVDRQARIASLLALAISAALVIRVIAIDNPEALVILAPAVAGGTLGLARPRSRVALLIAAALVFATAGVSLIGYVGFLYLPSFVLLVWAALHREP